MERLAIATPAAIAKAADAPCIATAAALTGDSSARSAVAGCGCYFATVAAIIIEAEAATRLSTDESCYS